MILSLGLQPLIVAVALGIPAAAFLLVQWWRGTLAPVQPDTSEDFHGERASA